MANAGSRTPPPLATWAEVDPARHPFDPTDVPELVRMAIPAAGDPEPGRWTESVSAALSDRFGPWAYHWYWGPGAWEQRGWITRQPLRPEEAPALVAGSLLAWRRWLERVGERFDRFLPSLGPAEAAGPDELVTTWESAIADLIRMTVAPVADGDLWQGWCRTVLRWLLTATGVPVPQAGAMVDRVVDRRFDHWALPTAADVVDIAERLTRDVLDLAGNAPAAIPDNWPDTWPQSWPTWRATNTTGP
jgi:hypothetical protein